MKPKSFSVIALVAFIWLGLSSVTYAQLVFNKVDIDGSFGQPSLLDADSLSYGLQPFEVTAALASADGIRYDGAFSAGSVHILSLIHI